MKQTPSEAGMQGTQNAHIVDYRMKRVIEAKIKEQDAASDWEQVHSDDSEECAHAVMDRYEAAISERRKAQEQYHKEMGRRL